MMKTFIFWLFITVPWLSAIGTIYLIGKERTPYSKEMAVAGCISAIIITLGLITLTN